MKKKFDIKSVFIVIMVIMLLLIIGFFFIYSKSDEKKESSNNTVSSNTYKTRDNRFVLRIVERNNEEAVANARVRYGEEIFEVVIKSNVRLYAYLNDRIFAIDEIIEDDNYALYSFVALPTEEYGHKILVNKQNNSIEVSEKDLQKVDNSCLYNGFCGFQSQPSFVKSNKGYYFLNNDNGLVTVYTTKWEKIGYLEKTTNIKLDSDGCIYVYDQVNKKICNGKYCEYEGIGTAIKYDIDGSKQ